MSQFTEEYCRVGCGIVRSCRNLPTFRRDLIYPSYRQQSKNCR